MKDSSLLELLIQRAKELGYTPTVSEVSGSHRLKERFGTWDKVVRAAGLPPPSDHEQQLLRAKIRKKRWQQNNGVHCVTQSEENNPVTSAPGVSKKSRHWKQGEPLTEADKKLLLPLIQKAAELGHTPTKSEVGSFAVVIKDRFRTWGNAVFAAGLPDLRNREQQMLRNQARRREQLP